MNPIEWLLEPANIAVAIVAINFAAFAAFGLDKSHAEHNRRRISEASLLQLAYFGGLVGAYAGRALFRHKTSKQPFSNHLHMIGVLQLFAAVFLTIFLW